MIKLLVLFAVKAITTSMADDQLDMQYGKLLFASVIFRHGDRSPTRTYPTDPYNETIWPDGFGVLSNTGKWQEYELGQWYRQKYNELLGQRYSKDTIYLMSSDTDRTTMSAECFLAGLYPPNEFEIWNPHLNWQPIPVHSITGKIDIIISPDYIECKERSAEEQRISSNSEFYMNIFKDNEETMYYVARHAGVNVTRDDIYSSFQNVYNVYDTLFVEDSYNLTLPSWTKPVYPDKLYEIGAWNFAFSHSTRKLLLFKIGMLLEMMIGNMTDVRDGNLQPNRTMMFYSAHDHNIVGFLSAINSFKAHIPPYASSVIVELRKKQQYNVLVLYKRHMKSNAVLIDMPGCPTPCSLDNFIDSVKDIIPDNWFYECDPQRYNDAVSSFSVIITISLLGVALVIAGCVIKCLSGRKTLRYQEYNNILDL